MPRGDWSDLETETGTGETGEERQKGREVMEEYMGIALDRDIAKGDAILDELMDDSIDEDGEETFDNTGGTNG